MSLKRLEARLQLAATTDASLVEQFRSITSALDAIEDTYPKGDPKESMMLPTVQRKQVC